MGIQNQALLSLNNVKAFRGYTVIGGIVQLSDDEAVQHIDATYGEAIVCNVAFAPGDVLRQVSPVLFRSVKAEYLEGLQLTLNDQISQGNDVDIDFHD